MSRGPVHYWRTRDGSVGAATLLSWAARDLELNRADRPRAVFVHAHPHGEPCVPGCRELVAERELAERPMTPAHDPPAPATVRDEYGRI